MPAKGIVYAVSHASYLINLASPKDDLWEKSIAGHTDEVVRAHAYAIPHVVLHPGAHTGSGDEAGMARISDALNRIHAATPGCGDTITCLELMAGQGTTLGRSFAPIASDYRWRGRQNPRGRLSRYLPCLCRRVRLPHPRNLCRHDGFAGAGIGAGMGEGLAF